MWEDGKEQEKIQESQLEKEKNPLGTAANQGCLFFFLAILGGATEEKIQRWRGP